MENKIIEIIDMDLSGRGIGRYNGKAVFIPGTIPGDTVEYVTVQSKKRYDIGELLNIISSSANRRDPECNNFGICGGCSFMSTCRELELDVKSKAVESAFRRAGIKDVTVEKIMHGEMYRYRNKAVFHRTDDGSYGFFSAASHECIKIDNCLLVPDIFNDIIRYTDTYFSDRASGISPASIMLRLGNGEVMLAAEVNSRGCCNEFLKNIGTTFPIITSMFECIGHPNSSDTEFYPIAGKEYIETDFCGVRLRISPKSFFQINTEVAEMFCDEIARTLNPSGGETILDLYCGIGTIGLTFAKRFPNTKVIGVEINKSAVNDATHNAEISGITNAAFSCADAGQISFDLKNPYAVIVDPPRYGLTDSMIRSILALSPEILVYMSCDPGTLAGDFAKLIEGGYRINRCVAGDMFPMCPHIETLAFMSKRV